MCFRVSSKSAIESKGNISATDRRLKQKQQSTLHLGTGLKNQVKNIKSIPSKWRAGKASSCPHIGMFCMSQLTASPFIALHFTITTSFACSCSVKCCAARAAGCPSLASQPPNLLDCESLKSCSLEIWLGSVCQVFVLSFFSSSLFTEYVLLICELLVSRNFSATWLFVVWISPSIIDIHRPIFIPLQLLRLTEFSVSLRALPVASGQDESVSASPYSSIQAHSWS